MGEVVTEEQAEALPEGQTAYPTESGELVVVDVTQPLPEVLVEEAKALRVPEAEVYENFLKTAEGSTTRVWRKFGDIGTQTGRHVAVVSQAKQYGQNGVVERSYWGAVPTGDAYAANRADENYGAATKEEAIAKAEEYIATSEYPEAYEIVVVE